MGRRLVPRYERVEDRLLFAIIQFFSPKEIGDIGRSNFFLSADIDGDNDQDIATPSEWFENDLQRFEKIHPLNFSPIRSGLNTIAVGDIDADGDIDMVYSSAATIGHGSLELHENEDGQGLFSFSHRFGEDQGGAENISIGDIDGDGDLDIVSNFREYFGNQFGGSIAWHENDSGIFRATHNLNLSSGDHIGPTTLVDIDDDGDLDIMTSRQKWFENSGSGEFFERAFYDEFSDSTDAQFGDMDGDGDIDGLVLRRSFGSSRVVWYENTSGKGDFAAPQPVEEDATDIRSVALADLDNDGDLDPILRSFSAVYWYQNENGNLKPKEQLVSSTGFLKFLVVTDLDKDNDLDFVSVVGADEEGDNRIVWYENSFDRPVGDVNCDGRFDSSDLLHVFVAGEYDDDIPNNSTYNEGDFNGDGDFNSSDFVFALTQGVYVQSAVFSYADVAIAILSDAQPAVKATKQQALVDRIAFEWNSSGIRVE